MRRPEDYCGVVLGDDPKRSVPRLGLTISGMPLIVILGFMLTACTSGARTSKAASSPSRFGSATPAASGVQPAAGSASSGGSSDASGGQTWEGDGPKVCTSRQLQLVLEPAVRATSGGTSTASVRIRNVGSPCTLEGVPAVRFLNEGGTGEPTVVTASNARPSRVILAAEQPPVPDAGGASYPYFRIVASNFTSADTPCPRTRQEQPSSLEIVLQGTGTFTVRNKASTAAGAVSSCDGRIQVTSVMPAA